MADELKDYSDAFEKFLEVNENDEPVLLASNLGDALAEAGLPKKLASEWLPLMDPDSTGQITFDKFVSVCMENKSDSEEAGGFSPGDFDDESDEDYEEEEAPTNPTMERLLAMFSNSEGKITADSLAKAGKTISVGVPPSDLEKMAKMCPDRASFVRLWRKLEGAR